MPERTYRGLLWTLALCGLLADQAAKYGVFAWLQEGESNTFALFQTEPVKRTFHMVPPDVDPNGEARLRGFFLTAGSNPAPSGWLGLDHVLFPNRSAPHVNAGALFGFLSDHKTMANLGFAAISLLAAGAIIYWSRQKSTAKDRWLCAALGLILAGTLGNFYDRVMFNGVRDFLHWNYYFDWPVFNLADCCLVVGASLLLLQAFLFPHQSSKPAEEESARVEGGSREAQTCGAGSDARV
jgi:signal peptidase II